MRIGALDRRAELLSLTGPRNAYNESIETRTVIDTVWCRLQGLPGREFIAAAQPHAEERVLITIRYRTDLTTKNAIRVDGREFDIGSIRELGRRQYLELACKRTES